MTPTEKDLIEQHKRRLASMPWLYFRLKPRHRVWAEPWQREVREHLCAVETVEVHPEAFVAPSARIFAEPGRPVRIGARSAVAHDAFLHGPIKIGEDVSINAGVSIDGGRAGVTIAAGARIATGVTIYAFDHGMAPEQPIRDQPVRSQGITIGEDVWIGAGAGITDGVSLGAGSVVAMGAVVTRDVEPGLVVAGVPARPLGRRGEALRGAPAAGPRGL